MMKSILTLPRKAFRDLVGETAARMAVHPAIVEKDIWVCAVLELIFTDLDYRDHFVFKGGTSLSKVFRAIHRFSEDIDLILDWGLLGYGQAGDLEMTSWSKQDVLNKAIDAKGCQFVSNTLLPWLAEKLALTPSARVAASAYDLHILEVHYSPIAPTSYLPGKVSLEIGPLAAWVPSSWHTVVPYVAERFEEVVGRIEVPVRVTSAERTFWEKATILHQQAHSPKEVPRRYARHYYDLSMLAQSDVVGRALSDSMLLAKVVEFKNRFYHSAGARYDLAVPGTLRLIPDDAKLDELKRDYRDMSVMFFSEPPKWETIVSILRDLEARINDL
jgi:hypothetical protein